MKREAKSEAVSNVVTEEKPAAATPPVGATVTDAAAPTADDAAARAEAARARAAQLIAERKYSEARQAIEEAEGLESGAAEGAPRKRLPLRIVTSVRSSVGRQLQRLPKRSKRAEEAQPPEESAAAEPIPVDPEERAIAIVSLYSKVAAVAGLVPGGLLNFAAILAVQVTMVWRIANTFGQRTARQRLRGIILSLLGSAVPTAVGGGVTAAVRSIPAIVAGTVAGFVITPVFAYALTKAVGSVFVMHFQSGGTLLNFDPKSFRDYFIKEFQEAGGTLASAN